MPDVQAAIEARATKAEVRIATTELQTATTQLQSLQATKAERGDLQATHAKLGAAEAAVNKLSDLQKALTADLQKALDRIAVLERGGGSTLPSCVDRDKGTPWGKCETYATGHYTKNHDYCVADGATGVCSECNECKDPAKYRSRS